MFYSKLYKEHYPFKSPSDILSLNEEERALLIKYIKRYPARKVEAIHKAWKFGYKVEGYPRPKGTFIACDNKLGDIVVELREICDGLITKTNNAETLTDHDIDNLNIILGSNQFCSVLSFLNCVL